MWVQPTILAPASGFSPWALFLREIRADMSAGRTHQAEVRGRKGQGLFWEVGSWWTTVNAKIKPRLDGGCAVNGCKMETD